jgi:hypothetical protein
MVSLVLSIIAIFLSTIGVFISSITFWILYLHKGTVKITKPRLISLGYERHDDCRTPKVFIRSLLYSTSHKGTVVENMRVKVSGCNNSEDFGLWAYGVEKLLVGSGLFISKEGKDYNHHFVPIAFSSDFEFSAGEIKLEIYASIARHKKDKLLYSITLLLTKEHEDSFNDGEMIIFNWNSALNKYEACVSKSNTAKLGMLELTKLF